MFELSIALKYLIPRKKQLSVSLIALMSIGVISLVVWLVIVFLSVTEGIEKNWLNKLTALNAPLRINPTEHYYSSYYYLSDAHSSSSQFIQKNISQKAESALSDPYSPDEDVELPRGFPAPDRGADGKIKDPVKLAYEILTQLQPQIPGLIFQDYEMSGALMRLQLLRKNSSDPLQGSHQNYLTQVCYLASLPDRSPAFVRMLLPPTEKDLNHLYYLSSYGTEYARQDAPSLTTPTCSEKVEQRLKNLLRMAEIKQLQSSGPLCKIPFSLLPEGVTFHCSSPSQNTQIPTYIILSSDKAAENQAILWRSKEDLFFQKNKGDILTLPSSLPLFVQAGLRFDVEGLLIPEQIQQKKDIGFKVRTTIQNIPLSGVIPWENLDISQATLLRNPENIPSFWPTLTPGGQKQIALPMSPEKESGVLLAKNYRESGVMIGDRGYLSYNSATPNNIQEHRLPIFVAGFYDPGIFSVGNRALFVPAFITQTINASSSTFNIDKTQANGILVWFNKLKEAEKIKQQLEAQFAHAGISAYWKVTTFSEYDFVKDLLQQFQSDKYLFSLIAAIILLVACCNIVSLLTLLVNDKKREIGILQAMGASARSIAIIFSTCGVAMGILSVLMGTLAAIFTLKHIDAIVRMLSFLQGHEAFNAAFFGNSLPNTLSTSALKFIFLLTPLLSLFAGLIPALKACRLRPSEILRSE